MQDDQKKSASMVGTVAVVWLEPSTAYSIGPEAIGLGSLCSYLAMDHADIGIIKTT